MTPRTSPRTRPEPRPTRTPRLALAIGALLALACGLPADEAAAGHHEKGEHAKAAVPRVASAPGARVYLISPSDGATISSPVTVRFGLEGMGVAPAGVARDGTGHHHLIVDADTPDAGLPIPSDDHHRHFGKGQTQVTLDLPKGPHTLQLVLGDHQHVPHDPPVVSKRIRIVVE